MGEICKLALLFSSEFFICLTGSQKMERNCYLLNYLAKSKTISFCLKARYTTNKDELEERNDTITEESTQ